MARKNLVVTGYTENGTFNRGLLSVTGNGVISNNFSVSGLTSLNGRSYLAAGQTQKYSNGYVYFKNWWNTSGTTTTVHFKLEGYSSPDFTKSAKFTVATNDATLTADSTAVWTHFRYIDRETGTVKSLSGVDSGFTSLSSDVTIFYVGNKTDSATQWNQVWETADTLDVTDDYFVKVYQCNAPLGGGTPTWVLKDIVLLRP
jgi:hypothetical protein